MINLFASSSMQTELELSHKTMIEDCWLSKMSLNKPAQGLGPTNTAVSLDGFRLQATMLTKPCVLLYLIRPIGKICALMFSQVWTRLLASKDHLASSLSITPLGPIHLSLMVLRTHGNGLLNECQTQTSTRLVSWWTVITADIASTFTPQRIPTRIVCMQSKDRLSNGLTTCWVPLPRNFPTLLRGHYQRCSFNERIIIWLNQI